MREHMLAAEAPCCRQPCGSLELSGPDRAALKLHQDKIFHDGITHQTALTAPLTEVLTEIKRFSFRPAGWQGGNSDQTADRRFFAFACATTPGGLT